MFNKLRNLFGKSEPKQATAIKLETRIRLRRGLDYKTTPITPETSRTQLFIKHDNGYRPVVRCTPRRAYEIRSILESAFAKLPAFNMNPATFKQDVEDLLSSDAIRTAVNTAIISTGVHPDTVSRFLQSVARNYALSPA